MPKKRLVGLNRTPSKKSCHAGGFLSGIFLSWFLPIYSPCVSKKGRYRITALRYDRLQFKTYRPITSVTTNKKTTPGNRGLFVLIRTKDFTSRHHRRGQFHHWSSNPNRCMHQYRRSQRTVVDLRSEWIHTK